MKTQVVSPAFCFFFIFISLIFSDAVLSQQDFREGWVSKVSGDTLFGEIDYRNDLLMGELCRFRSPGAEVTEFKPDEIKEFQINNNKYFISQKWNEKSYFMEYLVKGEIDILYLRTASKDLFFINKSDLGLTEIPFDIKVVNKGDKKYKYETKRHIGILKYYMQDAPALDKSISKMKDPGYQNLIKLGKKYHQITCSDLSCLEYYKKQPGVKVNPEILAGVVNFSPYDFLVDKYYPIYGVLANFWLPRFNEKIYFKTGVFYAALETTDGETYHYLKYPTHIGYYASNSYLVRPSVSIGLLSPSYSAGATVNVSNSIDLGIQTWVNFTYDKVPWIPEDLLNYYLMANAYFTF